MCEGCWDSYLKLDMHGQPVINDRVLAAVPLIRNGDPFGPLHIVIEDWNLDDENLAYCRAECAGDPDEPLLDALTALTLSERATAMAIADGYLQPS